MLLTDTLEHFHNYWEIKSCRRYEPGRNPMTQRHRKSKETAAADSGLNLGLYGSQFPTAISEHIPPWVWKMGLWSPTTWGNKFKKYLTIKSLQIMKKYISLTGKWCCDFDKTSMEFGHTTRVYHKKEMCLWSNRSFVQVWKTIDRITRTDSHFENFLKVAGYYLFRVKSK